MPLRDEDLPAGIVRSKPKSANSPLPPVPLPSEGEGVLEALSASAPRTTLEVGLCEAAVETVANTLPPSEGRGTGGRGENRITALEAQQKREGRVNVFIDGKFALGLFDDVVLTLGLRIGQQITPERLEEIAQAETLRKAIEDAYNLLSFRSRAEKEMSDRLQRKGYEEDVIAQVIEKLRAAGYLNDEEFARSWVAGRGKTLGRRALSHELRQKGVDGETVAQTLAEAKPEEAEQESARMVAVRKVGERPTDRSREARAKLAAFLQRRGFGWDTIRPILTDLYEIRDDADGDGDEDASDMENSDNE